MIWVLVLLFFLTLLCPIGLIPFNLVFLFLFPKKYKKYFLFFLSISIGVILFQIIPNPRMDLFRYFEKIEFFRHNYVDYWSLWESADPITYSLLYLVSMTSNNHYLPFISIILFYLFYFKSINDFLNLFELGEKEFNKALFFVLSLTIIISVGTGVRFSLAIAFFMNGVVSIQKNNNKLVSLLWFLLSVFSHTTLIIPIIIYIFPFIIKKIPSKVFYIIFSICLLSPPFIIKILELLSSIPALSILIVKLNYYFFPYFPWGSWYLFRLTVFFINLLLLLFKSQKYNKDDKINNIIFLENCLALICLLLLPYYYISIRFINIFNNLMIFIYIYNWYKKNNSKLINLILIIIFCLFSTYQIQLFSENNYGDLSVFDWFDNIFDLVFYK